MARVIQTRTADTRSRNKSNSIIIREVYTYKKSKNYWCNKPMFADKRQLTTYER
jgi:hypothetical protein